ncbi:MAG: response regulator [Pseudomonadota bacterium]
MSFALYRRPGGVVFLDDDPDYLEMLAQVMPADWFVRLFVRPVACIELLQAEPPQWDSDAWRQQDIINRWREGVPLISQILDYWREDGTARFGLTQICVVDYSMPAMSGLRVLGDLAGWSGARVLLTGRADEQLAVSAFNRGLIEQFIPKQLPEVRRRVTEAIQKLMATPDARHQQTWRATLSREQHALLCMPAVAAALEGFAARQKWVEHVVTGAPFGILAMDSEARVSWLQLEPRANLAELADMAESLGFDKAAVQDIRIGKKLVDIELQPALGDAHKPTAREAFAVTPDGKLHAALFPLDASFSPGYAASHAAFMSSRSKRDLSD